MIFRAILVWLVMMAVETVHGIVRGVAVVPLVGDVRARQIGVFVGAALILGVARLFSGWLGASTTRARLGVGFLWCALTFAFEIALGRLLGFSWDRIWSDYDPSRGGLMILGLAALFLSAVIAAKLKELNL